MNKKAIFGAIFTISTLGLAFSGLNSSRVSAVEVQPRSEVVTEPIELSDDVDEATQTSDTAANGSTSDFIPGLITQHGGEGGENGSLCLLEGDVAIPCPAECLDENGKFQACIYDKATNSYSFYQNVLEEGTADEPLVVCADSSEPGCEDTNSNPEIVEEDGETEEIEPETWPLIVSLAALGATIVFVIIINLFGRQK